MLTPSSLWNHLNNLPLGLPHNFLLPGNYFSIFFLCYPNFIHSYMTLSPKYTSLYFFIQDRFTLHSFYTTLLLIPFNDSLINYFTYKQLALATLYHRFKILIRYKDPPPFYLSFTSHPIPLFQRIQL